MDKYIYDESNGLWYELQGDYYIPCLTLPAEKVQPIGLWGQRHKRYLQVHKRAFYTTLLTSGKLNIISCYTTNCFKLGKRKKLSRLTNTRRHEQSV